MKRLLPILLFLSLIASAQEPVLIDLTFNKTVHVFFPSKVIYNDVGSPDVLIGVNEQILKLAAALENFSETNLTVITEDNTCYSFILTYKSDITKLNYYINKSSGRSISESDSNQVSLPLKPAPLLPSPSKSALQDSLDMLCEKALQSPFSYWNVGVTSKKVYLALNNIFISQNRLLFVVSVGNTSFVDYDIDYFKLLVTDKKRAKASSIQDIEKLPVYSYQKPSTIAGKTSVQSFVLVFDKFTIPQSRKLLFEMGEKNGGRTLAYSVREDLILEAGEVIN